MKRYIIAYDIPNDKRRRKIGETLEGYGKRVNFSVFEVIAKTDKEQKELEKKLLKLIKPKEDSLRFYHSCERCIAKSWSIGDESAPFEENNFIFL